MKIFKIIFGALVTFCIFSVFNSPRAQNIKNTVIIFIFVTAIASCVPAFELSWKNKIRMKTLVVWIFLAACSAFGAFIWYASNNLFHY